MTDASNSNTIAKLNDQFRQSFQGGKIHITQGIQHLLDDIQRQIFQKVRAYSNFTEDNDPYSEHDFGSIKIGIKTIFWKIDYYDLDLKHHSSDPTNPEVTNRVLTIMMADEY